MSYIGRIRPSVGDEIFFSFTEERKSGINKNYSGIVQDKREDEKRDEYKILGAFLDDPWDIRIHRAFKPEKPVDPCCITGWLGCSIDPVSQEMVDKYKR